MAERPGPVVDLVVTSEQYDTTIDVAWEAPVTGDPPTSYTLQHRHREDVNDDPTDFETVEGLFPRLSPQDQHFHWPVQRVLIGHDELYEVRVKAVNQYGESDEWVIGSVWARQYRTMIQQFIDGFHDALDELDLTGRARLRKKVPQNLGRGVNIWVELMAIPKYQTTFATRRFSGDQHTGSGFELDIPEAYARKPQWVFCVYVAAQRVEALYPFLDPAGKWSIAQRLEQAIHDKENIFGQDIDGQVVVKEARMLPEWTQDKVTGYSGRGAPSNFPMAMIMVCFE